MDPGEKDSRLRMAGRIAWRVLLPFSAMRKSVSLAKAEVERTKENLTVLKGLSVDARKTIADSFKRQEVAANDSFDAAMEDRSQNALSQPELYRYFLRRKRAALGAAVFFVLLSLYALLGSIWYDNTRGIVLGVVSLVASQPVFFMVALGAQLRLWQLRTHRLSKKEKGGLRDFTREVKGWWWMTLDPEFGQRGGGEP
jgi:hypothetical protein